MQDVSPATRAGSRALSLPSMRDATVASCAVFFFLVSHFWYPSHAARPYDGSYQNWLFENTKGQLLVSFAEEYAGNHAHAPEVLRVQGVVSMEALGAFGIAVVRVSSSLYMEKAAEDIRKLPNVEYVEPNHPIWADQKETNYEYEHSFKDPIIPWGIREINVEEAWKKSKGSKDVIVCVVDSGVDVTHEDLEPNIWTNTDEIPGNGLDDDDNGWIDDVHGYDFENSDSDPTDDHR